MKTADQNNFPLVGHYKFRPNTNEARILGDNPEAAFVMKTLFQACGWNVVDCTPPRKKKTKRKKGK